MSHLKLVVSQDVVEHVSVPAPGLVVITDGPELPGVREELRLAWQSVVRVGGARRLFSRRSRLAQPAAVHTLATEPEPFQLYLVG